MLTALKLKNIVLFESNELVFKKGFTTITGESGSGKSILFKSLDVLLGGQLSLSSSKNIQIGNDKSLIEGTFCLNNSLKNWLIDHEIDFDNGELLITKEWRFRENKIITRSRINGVMVNRKQILEIRPLLIDVTSQGVSNKIIPTEEKLFYIDKLADKTIENLKFQVISSWEKWKKLESKLISMQKEFDLFNEEKSKIEDYLDQLEKANIDDIHEIKKLSLIQDKLSNIQDISDIIKKISYKVNYGDDQNLSISDQINSCIYDLNVIKKHDNDLDNFYNNLFEIYQSFKNFGAFIHDYQQSLDISPETLIETQERLFFLKNLEKKYNKSLEELINDKNSIKNNLFSNSIEKNLENMKKEELFARNNRDYYNQKLTQARQTGAYKLETLVLKSLSNLALDHVTFKVSFELINPTKNGCDYIKFMFSANPGYPLRELEEAASGGEMSRFILAIKTILSSFQNERTFIFDEIDSGVSGKISASVGKLLRDLSLNSQVFCITHQPQVASFANHHLLVKKITTTNKSQSSANYLETPGELKDELINMAGGDDYDANLYADSLLEQKAA